MPSELPPLLLPATPALLEGWCGPVVTNPGHGGARAYDSALVSPYNSPHPFGTLVAGGRREPRVGRYVHAWNNMGRVVDADGNAHVVTVGEVRPVGGSDG